jgi:hypothetical protein
MAAPVVQKMSADFIVNGCNMTTLEEETVITTEEDTHASAVEDFGLFDCSREAEGRERECARGLLVVALERDRFSTWAGCEG